MSGLAERAQRACDAVGPRHTVAYHDICGGWYRAALLDDGLSHGAPSSYGCDCHATPELAAYDAVSALDGWDMLTY